MDQAVQQDDRLIIPTIRNVFCVSNLPWQSGGLSLRGLFNWLRDWHKCQSCPTHIISHFIPIGTFYFRESCLLNYSHSCAPITTINFRTFSITPRRNPTDLLSTPPPPCHHKSLHSLRSSATTNLLCVSIDLPILDIHIDGIIRYEVLCDWFLPLSMSFSKFIHVVAYISTSFIFIIQ